MWTTVSTTHSSREIGATDSLPSSTDKPLHRIPTSVDAIRRGKRWLYYHPRIQKIEGYHFGILCCAVVSAIVMVVNLTLTIWASKRYGVQEGLGTIRDGSCSETKNLDTWIHLGINILSTLLLGASNYTMQCLSSPTREDINKAHSQNVWLDIGTPSIRNLLRISRSRMLLWWLVAISSVPLHLMYNSAVFTTLSAREYNVFLVTLDFLDGAPFTLPDSELISGNWDPLDAMAQTLQGSQSSLQKLANNDCIGVYAAEFVSSHANVLAVSSDLNITKPIIMTFSSQTQGASDPLPWYCPNSPCDDCPWSNAPCDTKKIAKAATWQISGFGIEYCLSQKVEEHCKVQFSRAIMMVVIVCNLCKMIIMGSIAWNRPPEPLVTVGDAIASFLEQPDLTTTGNCLAGKDRFEKARSSVSVGSRGLRNWGEVTVRYDLRTSYWFKAVSPKRWALLFILCVTITTAIGFLINEGFQMLPSKSISYLWSLGFGRVTPQSLLSLPHEAVILTILLANSPQIVLSCFYVTLNGILTSMLLADELNWYAHHRKALRVTSPTGKQRSTYRLHIPYSYGVPLLVMFGIVHWLVSQSLFLARVTVYDSDGSVDALESISTCGFSLIAIFFVIIAMTIIIWSIVMTGLRISRPGMPLMGCCSAAISAACHPPDEDKNASKLPVRWGVVGYKTDDRTGKVVGHCTFTSLKVKGPVKGKFYAGQ